MGIKMNDEVKRLEEKIDELTARLRRVEQQVFPEGEGLAEHDAVAGPPAVEEQAAPSGRQQSEPAPAPAAVEPVSASAIVSFVGRSLVVLGGAFLLRWLTQSGILPQKVGSLVGMIYAILWIATADIKAGRGRRHSAVFHGVTGVCIAFPLLVEATTKLKYLSPMLSAILLPALIILGLVVAGRRNLRLLAWLVTVPAAPLAFFLAVKTQSMPPFLVSLLTLGFATLWLGYLRQWHVLATVMAGAVNFGLALMVMNYVITHRRTPAGQQAALWEVLFLLFGLIALYFGSYCFRVFKRKRTITPLEIGQTLVVALLGLGGAAMVINASEHSMLPLGIVCLTLSITCYTAAYGFLPRRDPNRRNFLFFTLLGLAMLLMGCEITFQPSVTALIFTAVSLLAGLLASRISSPVLYLHGAIYVIAAIVRSGMIGVAANGLAGSTANSGEWSGVPVLSALVVTVLYPWFTRPEGRATDLYLGRRAVDLFLLVSVLALGSLVVSLLAQLIPYGDDTQSYRRVLASLRTGTLATTATILAWSSRRTRFKNLAWLVYVILALAAIKLVTQDLGAGGAATLFISLGMYGGALILAPRLLHRTPHEPPLENDRRGAET